MLESRPVALRAWQEYCFEYRYRDFATRRTRYVTRCFLAGSVRHAEIQARHRRRSDETITGQA